MSIITPASLTGLDRQTGREWVEHELSKDEYSANDLTPLEQIGRWLDSVWESLLSAALRANSPWLLLFVVLGLAAIIALIVWRVRRVGLTRTRLPLSAFDPVVAAPDPGPWRDSAARAAAAGDLPTAVIDQSRAVFAVLSVKQIVILDSSSTASELARSAGAELPAHAASLHRVAEVFNDLLFGEETAAVADGLSLIYSEFVDLDRALSSLSVRDRGVAVP